MSEEFSRSLRHLQRDGCPHAVSEHDCRAIGLQGLEHRGCKVRHCGDASQTHLGSRAIVSRQIERQRGMLLRQPCRERIEIAAVASAVMKAEHDLATGKIGREFREGRGPGVSQIGRDPLDADVLGGHLRKGGARAFQFKREQRVKRNNYLIFLFYFDWSPERAPTR